jgi:hypothetical protein
MSRVSLGLVWLRLGRRVRTQQTPRSAQRPLTLRLSIAPSITVEWASRTRAVADHVTTAREPHARITVIVRALAARRAATARLLHNRFDGSAWHGLKAIPFNDTSRALGLAMASPVTLSASRRIDVRASRVVASLRRPVDVLGTSRFATVPMTSVRTRIEPRVLAPPLMVGRMQTVASRAGQARQDAHDLQSPLGFAVDERSGWMPVPGALTAAVPPGILASVTDHVVREIDSRVRAKRERLGKV